MSLPEDFWGQLPSKSDAELYDMLAHEQDYLPEAVAAAKQEIGKRNLAPERLAQLEAAVQSQTAAEGAKADERLGWPMRLLIFFPLRWDRWRNSGRLLRQQGVQNEGERQLDHLGR